MILFGEFYPGVVDTVHHGVGASHPDSFYSGRSYGTAAIGFLAAVCASRYGEGKETSEEMQHYARLEGSGAVA
jgi:hypothetical protein